MTADECAPTGDREELFTQLEQDLIKQIRVSDSSKSNTNIQHYFLSFCLRFYVTNTQHLTFSVLLLQTYAGKYTQHLTVSVLLCCFRFIQFRDEQTEIQFCFLSVKISTDLCITWVRQVGRKGRGEFRRCWQIKISHGKMTRVSAEGIGLPQTWGGWCRSSLDCIARKTLNIWHFLSSDLCYKHSPGGIFCLKTWHVMTWHITFWVSVFVSVSDVCHKCTAFHKAGWCSCCCQVSWRCNQNCSFNEEKYFFKKGNLWSWKKQV